MRIGKLLSAAAGYYAIVAVTVVSTVIALLLANALAEAYLRSNPQILMSEADRINENTRAIREAMIPPDKAKLWYDVKDASEVKPMWGEFYTAGAVFQSYVHFRSRTLVGRYYGVTDAGYRMVRDQGPWPPDPKNFNVFFFGGSTSFGVGPYWATIASYLQDTFNAQGGARKTYVYNFGRSGYISNQEVVLFGRLLSQGLRPDMVVFFDGLNDFCFWDGQPSSWQTLARHFDDVNEQYLRQAAGHGIVTHWDKLTEFVKTLPLSRLIDASITRSTTTVPTYTGVSEPPPDKPEDEKILRTAIARYIDNMRQVKGTSEAFGIVPVFVWQPIPTYKYDVSHHIFYPNRLGCHVNSKAAYPIMLETMKAKPLGESFIWAADIQEDLKEPLYIDAFHYTAPMSKRIAEFISGEIRSRRIPKD